MSLVNRVEDPQNSSSDVAIEESQVDVEVEASKRVEVDVRSEGEGEVEDDSRSTVEDDVEVVSTERSFEVAQQIVREATSRVPVRPESQMRSCDTCLKKNIPCYVDAGKCSHCKRTRKPCSLYDHKEQQSRATSTPAKRKRPESPHFPRPSSSQASHSMLSEDEDARLAIKAMMGQTVSDLKKNYPNDQMINQLVLQWAVVRKFF